MQVETSRDGRELHAKHVQSAQARLLHGQPVRGHRECYDLMHGGGREANRDLENAFLYPPTASGST